MIPLAEAAPPTQRRPTSRVIDPTAPIRDLPPLQLRQGNSRFGGAADAPITEVGPSMVLRPPKPMHPPAAQQGFQQNRERDAKRVPILERMNLPVRPDDTFTSDKVLSLNSTNFTKFLNLMDVTMVVFYNKGSAKIEEFEPIISQAACSTQRPNHAYAGVDCTLNEHLCQLNDATKLPLVRLYAKTSCVGQMSTLKSLSPETLRQFVEMAPGIESPELVSCQRTKRVVKKRKTIIMQE